MRRTKSGLPKHCGWNTDHHGKRRVRFRKDGFSTYLTGTPWGEDFMRQYAAALDGLAARKADIGADRWPSGSLGSIIAAYLDSSPESSSPFKALALATRQMRRRMLDRWRAEHGQLPLFRTGGAGRRIMLLTRQHVQTMVNRKAATPFEQRNFLHTLRAVFKWALEEGRIPDDRRSASPGPRRGPPATRRGARRRSPYSRRITRSAARRGSRSRSCSIPGNGAATSCAWASR